MTLPILILDCQLTQADFVGYNLTLYKQAYKAKRTKFFLFPSSRACRTSASSMSSSMEISC